LASKLDINNNSENLSSLIDIMGKSNTINDFNNSTTTSNTPSGESTTVLKQTTEQKSSNSTNLGSSIQNLLKRIDSPIVNMILAIMIIKFIMWLFF
jgi:hypothetical protein